MDHMSEIEKHTYSLHHNPNCRVRYQVRICGTGAGKLDDLPFPRTSDILGHGETFEAAVQAALQQLV